MYICDDCKRHIGPNIPEIRVPKGYREDGKGVTGEYRTCPFCALKRLNISNDDEFAIMVRKSFMKDKKKVVNRTDIKEDGAQV